MITVATVNADSQMISAKQREVDFRADLQQLLEKHRAKLQITDDGKSYGMQSGVCRIIMMSVYSDTDCVMDYCEFDV